MHVRNGYVVDKAGKPIIFRVKNPDSDEVSTGVMLVRGGAVAILDATPQQFDHTVEQMQPVPGPRIGAMPGENTGGPAMPLQENGVVVADQAQPSGYVAPATPPAAPAPAPAPASAQEGQADGERPAALAHGPAAEL